MDIRQAMVDTLYLLAMRVLQGTIVANVEYLVTH